MNVKNKAVIYWPLVLCCLGILALLAACATGDTATATGTPATPVPAKTTSLRLENGAVEVQDENNDWRLAGGKTTFELVGELESIDPWMVTGNTFAARDSTRIAEGLAAGDLVRVKGVILEDRIWLANSIEPAEEQIDPSIVLIGKVDSLDPWIIDGITLNLTDDPAVAGEILPGMIVEVEILLLADGAWEVLSLASLSDFMEIPGCATVTATVVSVDGNEVQFAGWPAITLAEDVHIENESGNAATLGAHQLVLVVVCATEAGQFRITKLIILKTSAGGNSARGEKVLVCHKPDKKGGHTLNVSAAAVPAHLRHGDKLGACP